MKRANVFFVGGLLVLLLFPAAAQAQGWGNVAGRITDAGSGLPIPGAAVVVDGTNYGTATDGNGRYDVRLPEGSYSLRFSSLGYAPTIDSVTVVRDERVTLNVALEPGVMEVEGVTVSESAVDKTAGVYSIDPEDARTMPTPIKDGLRVVKSMPGVVTNNELSSRYSVRGGGFNENLLFINGFQVFLPFRPRQAEQEGLSPINAELADRITFYTGGFPARYGGKLSSALDVTYRPHPGPPQGAAYISLLDAGLAASATHLDGRVGWLLGVRKARAGQLFGTQELKGHYRPDYTDVQGLVSVQLAEGHNLEAIGLWAHNIFELEPTNRRVTYGLARTRDGKSDLKSLLTEFDGIERSGYTTGFGGMRLSNQLTDRILARHDLSIFDTEESEFIDVSGSSELLPIDKEGEPAGEVISSSTRIDAADNRVRVRMLTGKGRYMYTLPRHSLEVGWKVRRLQFEDRLNEKSVVEYVNEDGEDMRLVSDSLRDQAQLGSWQAGGFAQDAVSLLPDDRLLLTAGVRADYFAFNNGWTLSPRLSARYQYTDQTTLMGSWGIYHQAPTYRELRGEPETGEFILDALNRDLVSQRSVQIVAGVEHFLPERRFYLRAEAYYKALSNLISYRIDDVRVVYSGENDAEGYAYGLDLQLRGEFVPGLESWVNYSYLITRARFSDAGMQEEFGVDYLARPTDQRHTFSMFLQDYIPGNRTWQLHMRFLFGSGLPYTPLVPEQASGGIAIQGPGDRNSGRLPMYRRVDFGATKELTILTNGLSRPLKLFLTAELLNIFDMTNVVAYSWEGRRFHRIPKRLTPRTFNVRLRMQF